MKVKSEREVAQLCWTLSDPMDYSPPGSSIYGIFQARVLEWGATAFSLQHPPQKITSIKKKKNKKPVPKGHILYDSIYMKCLE